MLKLSARAATSLEADLALFIIRSLRILIPLFVLVRMQVVFNLFENGGGCRQYSNLFHVGIESSLRALAISTNSQFVGSPGKCVPTTYSASHFV